MITETKNNFLKLEKARQDRAFIEENKGEIMLSIAHYALFNSNHRTHKPKIVIYGLGSCIALILYEQENNIQAMSHILLPESNNSQKASNYPHKYANSSVKDLLAEFLRHGAKRENIKAIIVGGAKIFQGFDNSISEQNIHSIKKELAKYKIKIKKQDLGGSKGRILKYDPNDNSVLVKETGASDFKRLN